VRRCRRRSRGGVDGVDGVGARTTPCRRERLELDLELGQTPITSHCTSTPDARVAVPVRQPPRSRRMQTRAATSSPWLASSSRTARR
jgi:hypothetical protein